MTQELKQKSKNHHKILGARRMTKIKFHIHNPRVSVATATMRSGFMHPRHMYFIYTKSENEKKINTGLSETSVIAYKTIRFHCLEDDDLNLYFRHKKIPKNFK